MHKRIARAIKAARGPRSAQWLADRTEELGYPISRAQIANYETGKKKNLDIAELTIIAAALDLSPMLLIYPGPYGEDVDVLPYETVSQYRATQWFSVDPSFEMDGTWGRSKEPVDGDSQHSGSDWVSATAQYRKFSLLQAAERQLVKERFFGSFEDRQEAIELYERQIRSYKQELGMEDDA